MCRVFICVIAILALAVPVSGQSNVLLIISDDVGVDLIGAYREHPEPGRTPVINELASQGVLFRNAWSNPVCSPTRSSMLTGRYSFRSGVGYAIQYGIDNYELYPGEVSLPDILSPTYETAAVGKWHLGAKAVSSTHHPQMLGFDHFRGNMIGFPGPFGNGYYEFEKVVDSFTSTSTTYSTTDIVDDALDLISAADGPWFLWVAFNAPHAPFHKPPPSLHSYDLPVDIPSSIPVHARAMLEAMDTEIGRLFASMDPQTLADTFVIFVGDNGTTKDVVLAPSIPDKAKETVYEGGVNVPVIVVGPGVAKGAECKALVNLTDIFATVAEIAGVPAPSGLDSVSMVPYFQTPTLPSLRAWVYSEQFKSALNPPFCGYGPYQSWDRVVRGSRYKLMWEANGFWLPDEVSLFDLRNDPFEEVDLLDSALSPAARRAYGSLTATMNSIIPTWLDVGHGLEGTNGLPRLRGVVDPLPGATVTLILTRARPNALTQLVVGLSSANGPFMGGVLVPKQDLIIGDLSTDEQGKLSLPFMLPLWLAPADRIYFQHRIVDPVAPAGVALSNALVVTVL